MFPTLVCCRERQCKETCTKGLGTMWCPQCQSTDSFTVYTAFHIFNRKWPFTAQITTKSVHWCTSDCREKEICLRVRWKWAVKKLNGFYRLCSTDDDVSYGFKAEYLSGEQSTPFELRLCLHIYNVSKQFKHYSKLIVKQDEGLQANCKCQTACKSIIMERQLNGELSRAYL